MPVKDPNVLKTSKDPKVLLDAAVAFAQSDQPADLSTLGQYLQTADFLDRLEAPATADQGPALSHDVARLLKLLMDNPAPQAKAVLASLTQSPPFTAINNRNEVLIRALVTAKPPSPAVVTYLDKHTEPKAVFRHVAMDTICDNGAEVLIQIMEKKLADPRHKAAEKIAWMRDPILRHRNDPAILKSAQRLVTQGLPPELRLPLVEALFDHEEAWYVGCSIPQPPPRLPLPAESREILTAIGQYALDNLTPSPELAVKIKATLKTIEPQRNTP